MTKDKKLFCWPTKDIKGIAILFIIATLVLCLLDYFGYCRGCVKYASVFATLTGAILVFSTLEIQSLSLEEEKNKNKIARFDSRFYPILSSFRTDAANVEIIRKYIVNKGIGIGQESQKSFTGDKAFCVLTKIIEMLHQKINENSFVDYSHENLLIELSEISNKEEALEEQGASIEEFEKLCIEKRNAIQSQQAPFLLYTYGFTKDVKEKICHLDSEKIYSFILKKLLEQQPATFTKYIRTLRFIIYIIEQGASASEKEDYYLNIYSQLEKNELSFLKKFKEFDCITNNGSIDKQQQ